MLTTLTVTSVTLVTDFFNIIATFNPESYKGFVIVFMTILTYQQKNIKVLKKRVSRATCLINLTKVLTSTHRYGAAFNQL